MTREAGRSAAKTLGTLRALKDPKHAGPFDGYDPKPFFCELLGTGTQPSKPLIGVWQRFQKLDVATLLRRAADAERELFNLGITFTVYSDKDAIDRILPFDVIPRVMMAAEWRVVEAGVIQRVRALNMFLWDVYHKRHILNDGTVPAALVLENRNYRPEMVGFDPPHGTYVHINGTDLVRDGKGAFHVLEDNGRAPSGVSYVVENRHMMQRAFPDLMQGLRVRPVSDYGERLLGKLIEVAPSGATEPSVVLLSPGVYNAAYSSTFSSPARWACRWSRGAIWWWRTITSLCKRSRDWLRLMSSTGASTTTSSIPRPSIKRAGLASPA